MSAANDNIVERSPFDAPFDRVTEAPYEVFESYREFIEFMEQIAASYPEAQGSSHWETMMEPVYEAYNHEVDMEREAGEWPA